MEVNSDKPPEPVLIQDDRPPVQRQASGCWVMFAFLCGGMGGCAASGAVFHASMDVNADGVHPDSNLMSATALVMLLSGLLAALLTWRWSFGKK
jgi:hypothetical protein